MFDILANRRVLMLQGPMGPFFRRVAAKLRDRGAVVTKINFNAGDRLYYGGPEAIAYRGTFPEWPRYFEEIARTKRINAAILFGDCRPYHEVAIERAAKLGIDVFVFEEGYLRPDFVTMELGGVTGNSKIPKDPAYYRKLTPKPLPEPRSVGNTFPTAAIYAVGYALTHGALGWRYPHYHHHRDLQPLRQAAFWARGGLRRVTNTWRDRNIDRQISDGALSPYFLVPLQVHLDSQLRHCPFDRIEDFIRLLVKSFAEHAPAATTLMFKHHPFDRPYRDYAKFLDELGEKYRLGSRLLYVDVINLPLALRKASGTVVINSTVGLSSIFHGTPVKCLGSAVYDIDGMAFQGSLDEFWTTSTTVDKHLYDCFRWWLRTNNQLNGDVWRGLIEEADANEEQRRLLHIIKSQPQRADQRL